MDSLRSTRRLDQLHPDPLPSCSLRGGGASQGFFSRSRPYQSGRLVRMRIGGANRSFEERIPVERMDATWCASLLRGIWITTSCWDDLTKKPLTDFSSSNGVLRHAQCKEYSILRTLRSISPWDKSLSRKDPRAAYVYAPGRNTSCVLCATPSCRL